MNFHLKHARDVERLALRRRGRRISGLSLRPRHPLRADQRLARGAQHPRGARLTTSCGKRELGAKQQTSLVNRFLYETGGNFGLSMFVRQAARAKDFHRYLERMASHTLVEVAARRRSCGGSGRHEGRCQHKPGAALVPLARYGDESPAARAGAEAPMTSEALPMPVSLTRR